MNGTSQMQPAGTDGAAQIIATEATQLPATTSANVELAPEPSLDLAPSVSAVPLEGAATDPTVIQAGTDSAAPAMNPATLSDQLVDFLQVGGPVVWILMGFSVVALSIALLKLWQFARLRPESDRDLELGLGHWRAGRTTQALESLDRRRPASELVALAMDGLNNGNDNRELDLLKDELERVATLRLNQLRSFLRPLDVIATLSPLLGLLGTVLGMIVAFQQMEAAGSQVDPSVLSGGIWQALLTTAVGLAVAIPVVTLHNWLERKTERVAALMSDGVTRVFTSQPGKPKLAEAAGAARHAA